MICCAGAVAHHTDERWVLLCIERWLKAPIKMPDGTIVAREKGTPQGSPISPLLANLFMHYAFDRWIAREFPGCPFERYADDIVAHCDSEQQARRLQAAIAPAARLLGARAAPREDQDRVLTRTRTAEVTRSTPALTSFSTPSGAAWCGVDGASL
jgi:retron-type reverse transcriptase